MNELDTLYCCNCGAFFEGSEFDSFCENCFSDRLKRESFSQWRRLLKSKYSVDVDWYGKKFLSQKGKCAICEDDLIYRGKETHIDHNHTTGEPRGLLCRKCNTHLVPLVENYRDFKQDKLFNKIMEYLS